MEKLCLKLNYIMYLMIKSYDNYAKDKQCVLEKLKVYLRKLNSIGYRLYLESILYHYLF